MLCKLNLTKKLQRSWEHPQARMEKIGNLNESIKDMGTIYLTEFQWELQETVKFV